MRNLIFLGSIVVLFLSCSTAFAIGGGDITFTPKNADPVHFSHDYHLKIRGLKCAACHFARLQRVRRMR